MTSENRKDHDKRTKNHALTLKTGPSVLFDMNEVTDSRTLDIQLIRDDFVLLVQHDRGVLNQRKQIPKHEWVVYSVFLIRLL